MEGALLSEALRLWGLWGAAAEAEGCAEERMEERLKERMAESNRGFKADALRLQRRTQVRHLTGLSEQLVDSRSLLGCLLLRLQELIDASGLDEERAVRGVFGRTSGLFVELLG